MPNHPHASARLNARVKDLVRLACDCETGRPRVVLQLNI